MTTLVVPLLLLLFVSTTIVAQNLDQQIRFLQASEKEILDQTVLDDPKSYQSLALNAATDVLRNPTSIQVRNFYALACIYFASNGRSNPIVESSMPGCPTLNWLIDDWLLPDYCLWYGVTCNEDKHVIKINLSNNQLYGIWPNEVVLLHTYLEHINVNDNPYLYSEDPKWLDVMASLQYLYFGTTSWYYPGVPTYLGGVRNLVELDMSNSLWTDGPIRPLAFKGLSKLERLNMGHNTWNTTGLTEFPPAVSTLPQLKVFSLRGSQFTPNPLNLRFITRMPVLSKCWLDYTQFTGTIPALLGRVSTLTSFSCSYCGLQGKLPSELGNSSNLVELWLYGNQLSGSIPTELGLMKNLSSIFLEGNLLTGSVPNETICSERNITSFGVDCDVNCTCCSCCGKACGNLLDPSPAPSPRPTFRPLPTRKPTRPKPSANPAMIRPTKKPTKSPTQAPTKSRQPTLKPTPGGIVPCFPGDSMVDVLHKGLVHMRNVVIGDFVKVASGNYEPIYSFGHRRETIKSEFLQIYTNTNNSRPLEISHNHMVLLEDQRFIPASMVREGDILLDGSSDRAIVQMIRKVVRNGLYAPFTKSGTIVIDNIICSNYIAYNESEYLMIAGVSFSYHGLAHGFNALHRLAVRMGFHEESYTETGISHWVHVPHEVAGWVIEQDIFTIAVTLVPCIILFGLLSTLESILESSITLVTFCIGLVTLFCIARGSTSWFTRITKR